MEDHRNGNEENMDEEVTNMVIGGDE